MRTCPKCGSSEIDTGAILSAGKISYKTDLQKHPFLGPNAVTYCCLQCGYTETYIDEEYRRRIRERMESQA